MRDLNQDALDALATKLGTEPVTIVEIDWALDGGTMLYADRFIDSIPGKIQELGDLDNVINISDSDSSQELSMVLDDADGTIKEIMNVNDIHKRDARVYQWFEGLDLADRFMLFAGKISTPITWSERDRTVSFTIISQLEDKEIGFSAEEGDFQWIPKDLIGKTWPMIFGTVLDVPALQFNHAVTGTTLCPIGNIVGEEQHTKMPLGGGQDLGPMLANAMFQHSLLNCVESAISNAQSGTKSADKRAQFQEQLNQIKQQHQDIRSSVSKASNAQSNQQQCATQQRADTLTNAKKGGCNPVDILGGEDFPQNTNISLQVGSTIARGHFKGSKFYYSSLTNADREKRAQGKFDAAVKAQCGGNGGEGGYGPVHLTAGVPCGGEDVTNKKGCTCTVNGHIVQRGGGDVSRPNTDAVAEHIWIDAGTQVSIASDENITYLVSIIPGTVMAVKAYKQFTGEKRLVNVPNNLWWVTTEDYGPVTSTQVVVKRPLSSYDGQGWSDQIYVTYKSTVGPHTIDIIQHIIDNYTDLQYDVTTFDAIRTKLDPFPMNFPILTRKNTLNVLQEIAFQARCALWLSNGKFYIKYLPEEPASDATITLSDLDAETSVELELTSTEDLVTKMIVEWRLTWADEDPSKIILRHNVKKYGTQEASYDFYCFNQPDTVMKVATFWLIRKSNTWKRVRFKTFLNHLSLETFDTATLDFGSRDFISTNPVKSIVEEATYNSDDRTIDFICLTPVKSGDMSEYKFFWPAYISTSEEFPTQDEIDGGLAGGDGIGSEATGVLPIGFIDINNWGDGVVWVGGPNVVFTGHSDYGDRTPTDIDYVAQPVSSDSTYAELDVSESPDPDMTLNYVDNLPLPTWPGSYNYNDNGIDIRSTIISDSKNPDVYATLDTIYKAINPDGKLVIDADAALYGDEQHADGEVFDYRYDSDGEVFGAGTAFLKDEDA